MGIAQGKVVAGRYRVVRSLGGGAQAETWLADDTGTGQAVALKIMRLRGLDSWKAVELWQRECAVLRALDHPAIPRYVEALEDREAGDLRFILVQTYVAGQTLKEMRDAGQLFSPESLIDLTKKVLAVLDYLHTRQPPVIHRDLKPSNIMLRSDGSVAIIDFGGVQTVAPVGPEGGSTVVGTHGYMPAEQLMGRATPASDLYALAATIVHLASGHAPSDLEVVRMKLQFEHLTALPQAVEAWLARMLAPVPEDRFASAADAATALDAAVRTALLAAAQPASSRPAATAISRTATSTAPNAAKPAHKGLRGKNGRAYLGCVLMAGLIAVAVFSGISHSCRSKSRLGSGSALETLSPLPVRFPGAGNGPALHWKARRTQLRSWRGKPSLARIGFDVQNIDTLAVNEAALSIRPLDASGAVLKSREVGLIYRDGPPLEPGEARTFDLVESSLPADTASFELTLAHAGVDRPFGSVPVRPISATVLAFTPPGAAVSFAARRFVRNLFDKGLCTVHLDIANTGTVWLAELEFEVSIPGKPKRRVRGMSHHLDRFAPGARTAVAVSGVACDLGHVDIVAIKEVGN